MRASLLAIVDYDDVFPSSGVERIQPGTDRRPIPLYTQYGGPRSVDQELTQIDVTSLADAEQPRFTSCRILPWHDPKPRSKVAPLAKGCAIADGSNDGRTHDWSNPRDSPEARTARIAGRDTLQLAAESFNLVF